MSLIVTTNGLSSLTSSQRRSLSLNMAILIRQGALTATGLKVLQQEYRAPTEGTQKFAEAYRSFKHPTPWFHSIWYEAYDSDDWDHVYVQGPREHAKTSTVL